MGPSSSTVVHHQIEMTYGPKNLPNYGKTMGIFWSTEANKELKIDDDSKSTSDK